MSKYEEKMKALQVLKAAVDKVDEVMAAIDDFADTYGIAPKTISVEELARVVGKVTHKSPFCVEEILRTALDFLKENRIETIVAEDDDDDSEDE